MPAGSAADVAQNISDVMQQEITNVAVGQFICAQQYHELWLNQMQQGIRKERQS